VSGPNDEGPIADRSSPSLSDGFAEPPDAVIAETAPAGNSTVDDWVLDWVTP
jgi:hypothetical protein